MLRKFITASMFLLILCTASYSAEKEDPILASWSHENNFVDKDGDQELNIKATYYSNEYIETRVAIEAEKNLWTADEAENYKYALLKNLNLADTIPFHIYLYVRGLPMYPGQFDKHVTLLVGKKKYSPVDYDKRLNFKILGERDGMIYFPRYDSKTGKDILDGAKELRLTFDSSISMAINTGRDVIWVWDLTKDRGSISGGKAANRLEVDRLLKRTEKLNADREALQKQLEALNKEYEDVNSRIDELQAQ